MRKQLIAAGLCVLLTAAAAGTVAAQPAATAYDIVDSAAKDETVYISLDAGGQMAEINVVNRMETPQNGVYTDYGNYEKITNLTNDVKPQVDGGAVSWQLDSSGEGFYYQGKLNDGIPPLLFTVTYRLDGRQMPAQEMAGRSGHVAIGIEAKPNAAAPDHFTRNYFCQIQASLNLDKCRNIEAAGATGILAGRTKNVGFTVLPGKQADYEISFVTDGFTFDGFTITAMPFDQKSMTGIDTAGMRQDIQKMADGTQELVDGTQSLKDGLGELSDGVSDLSGGAGSAKNGLNKYKTGVKQYTGGVTELAASARQLAGGMQALALSGQDVLAGYTGLSAGLDAVLTALSPAAPPELAAQIAALRAQMPAYGQGLESYVSGVSEMASGMNAFADGLEQLDESGAGLVSGLSSIVNGMAKLADGLSQTAVEVNKLPDEVQKLIDGQRELKDGVDEAAGIFGQWDFGADPSASPVSFVSPRNAPRSVQFIYKTAEIASEKDEAGADAPAEPEKGFFQKLGDLFR